MSETSKALDDLAVECGAASMVRPFTHPHGPRTAVKFKLGDGSLERFAAAILATRPAAPSAAAGVPADGCNYLSTAGSVCNKCGQVHQQVKA